MSHSEPDSTVVSTDMVTIEKSLERRQRGVVVTLALGSETDDPVAVRIVDAVPEDCPTEEIGFHPEHEPRNWSIDGNEVVCECVAPPADDHRVVYGITMADGEEPDTLEPLLGEPAVERARWVDPAVLDTEGNDPLFPESDHLVDGDDDGDSHSGGMTSLLSDVKNAVLSDDGSAKSGPGTAGDGSDIDGGFEPPDTGEGSRGAAATETDTEVADGEADPDRVAEADGSGRPMDGDGSVDVAPHVDPGTTDESSAFAGDAVEGDPTKSLEVRMRYLHSRVDEFAAYADALEGIIDEHGTATEIQEEFDDAEAERETLRDHIEEVSSDVEALGDEVSDLREEFDTVRTEIDELRTEVRELATIRDAFSEAFGNDGD